MEFFFHTSSAWCAEFVPPATHRQIMWLLNAIQYVVVHTLACFHVYIRLRRGAGGIFVDPILHSVTSMYTVTTV
jgi:hypothetical protein